MDFPGKLAFVDLTRREVVYQDVPLELVRAYLGGRGLNMYFLLRFLRPDTDPFAPENPLLFASGLLTGTNAPSSARWQVSARSPETYILGDANAGGHFGSKMRQAGFANLIITGRASGPVILFLKDGKVEIRDGRKYWGMDTYEVQETLKADFADHGRVECAVISRAGENLVRFAAVMHGKKASAARGGMGAVMGSKNLKAVVATSPGKIDVYNDELLKQQKKEMNLYMSKSGVVKTLGKYGTPFLYKMSNQLGAIRTKNSQLNAFDESLVAENFEKYYDRMHSCFNCIVHCRSKNTLGGEGPEYSSIGTMGSNCGIADVEDVIRLVNRCNELGLDTSSAGSIIAWAVELYERGLINQETTRGRQLEWGNSHMMFELLDEIVERRGFGNVLAESTRAVPLGHFPEAANDYLIAAKGLPQTDPHDARIIKSFALGLAVASRGMDHLRNRPTLDIMQLPAEYKEQLYGRKVSTEITDYDTKDFLVYYHENVYTVNDSLGLCRFVCHGFNSPHLLGYAHYVDLLESAWDLNFTREELDEVARRTSDTERLLNERFGISRKDDTLPKRYFDDPIPLKGYAGEKVDRQEFDRMLDGYYALRGWDNEGHPPESRRREVAQLLDVPLGA